MGSRCCSCFVLELTDHKIKIPTEMIQNLMILHSYILVKVGEIVFISASSCSISLFKLFAYLYICLFNHFRHMVRNTQQSGAPT